MSTDKDLDRSFLESLAWTGGLTWVAQLLTWVSTVVVARLLSPEDYGLVMQATVVLGLFMTLSEFGIQSTVVVMRDLTDEAIEQLNTLVVLFNLTAAAVVLALAHPLSWFFESPDLVGVVYALAANFVVIPLSTVPFGLLQKDLRFKLIAIINTSKAIIMGLVMMLMAYLGFRYWTLVIGQIASASIVTAAALYFRPCRFRWPVVDEVRDALQLAWEIIASRFSWYFYSQSDFLIAGKMLGKDLLGAYSLTWSVANIPVEKVTALVTNVTPSYFAAVQKDIPALRRYFLGITEGLAWVTLPAGIGLALVTTDFVSIVFGDQWVAMTEPLRILALYAAFRSLVTLHPQLLTSMLDARLPMKVSVAMAIVMPPAFYVGSHWGPEGIAYMWLTVYPLLTIPLYIRVFSRLDMTLMDYLRNIWPVLSSCAVMTLCVLGVGTISGDWHEVARFSAQVSSGVVGYLAAIALFHRRRFKAALDMVRGN